MRWAGEIWKTKWTIIAWNFPVAKSWDDLFDNADTVSVWLWAVQWKSRWSNRVEKNLKIYVSLHSICFHLFSSQQMRGCDCMSQCDFSYHLQLQLSFCLPHLSLLYRFDIECLFLFFFLLPTTGVSWAGPILLEKRFSIDNVEQMHTSNANKFKEHSPRGSRTELQQQQHISSLKLRHN